jgi:hypothetical protein
MTYRLRAAALLALVCRHTARACRTSAIDPRIESLLTQLGKVKPIEAWRCHRTARQLAWVPRTITNRASRSLMPMAVTRMLSSRRPSPAAAPESEHRLGTRFAPPGVRVRLRRDDQHKAMQNNIYLADTTGKHRARCAAA